jgi:hypothetical protein
VARSTGRSITPTLWPIVTITLAPPRISSVPHESSEVDAALLEHGTPVDLAVGTRASQWPRPGPPTAPT